MLIRNGTVVLPDRLMRADVETAGDIISAVGEISREGEDLDASGLYVCPGFVDIHAHGGGGSDFMDHDEEAFDTALAFHAANGTTSMLPTSLTAPVGDITAMIGRARPRMKRTSDECANLKCSRVLGVHTEGPYLSLKNKGAQPESYLRIPDRDSYDYLLENRDAVRSVTLSCELSGAAEMTRRLTEAGIIVCGGHDNGSMPDIMPVIDAGMRHCTHLWCAMSTVAMIDGVRLPGLCEIGLTDDRLSCEIIADGFHMPPALVKIAYRCKGADRLAIVSDCLRAGGMPEDGRLWSLGDGLQSFIVSGGVGRLPDNSRLAGSIQPLSHMVRNLVCDCSVPVCDAVRMASLTPAKIIGRADKLGSVEAGKLADLCLMTPDLRVHTVIIGGKIIYSKGAN